MKNILGIILLAVGIFLLVQGYNRKDSLVGTAATATSELANKVDGGAHTPRHVIYMVGGGVIAIIGLGVLFRKSSAV